MFTRIAEKLGILDIIAPRNGGRDNRQSSANNVNANNNNRNRKHPQHRKRRKQEDEDGIFAQKLQTEEDRRFQTLKSQKEEEDRAQQSGKFAKKQRVSYHHRGNNTDYDAVIAGVHFDDGPDKPYYTIKYTKVDVCMDDEGNEVVNDIIIEKQTTPDRLTALPWDEEKVWEVVGDGAQRS